MHRHPLSLEAACRAIRSGRPIVFPTETFYGIGCDAMNADAVGAVFTAKRRPTAMPMPVVLSSRKYLPRVAAHVPKAAVRLMDIFWPGPLSILFPAVDDVPDLLCGNSGRVAVRCSSHPAPTALCEASDRILVASSANVSGFEPVASMEELSAELLSSTAGIFLSGPAPTGGKPSTVVDVRDEKAGTVVRIMREGAVSEDALRNAGFIVDSVTP